MSELLPMSEPPGGRPVSRRRKVATPRTPERRLDRQRLLEPLASVFALLPAWRRDLAAKEGNPGFLQMLAEGRWGDGAKAVVIEEFFDRANEADGAELVNALPELMDFWKTNVPDGILGADTPFDVRMLLCGNFPFLRALNDALGAERFAAVLRDPEAAGHFRRFQETTLVLSGDLGKWEFAAFASRNALPINWDEGEEKRGEEMADVISSMGIEPILRKVASRVRAVPVAGAWASTGQYDEMGEITFWADGEGGKDLPDTLVHEAGHGVQAMLESTEPGRASFVRFVVAAALEPQTHSTYAESFRIRDGGSLTRFVSESFAEDFRLFFFAPERLPPLKRRAIGGIVASYFSEVDPEDVRRRVRSVLGNFYGRSVEDALRPTNCENARREARYADRVEAEDARDEESAAKRAI